jgi:hypothetical protein
MAEYFPEDENGDVLRRMERNGDDLSVPRDINFSVVFSSEEKAENFADFVRQRGLKASVENINCVQEAPWDVIVTKHMRPTHKAISDFEEELDHISASLGGRNDGWGCFSQPALH